MKKFIFKKNTRQSGYTIIETMIAVSLFVGIVMMGMGSLLNANMVHNKTQNMRSIMDTLSFAMEDISRSLKTGYNYHCLTAGQTVLPTTPKSCPGGGYGIAFEMAPEGVPGNNDDQWVYYVQNSKLYKSTKGVVPGVANIVQLTPDEVVINSAFFISVFGAEPPPDVREPFVIIRLGGTITYKGMATPFSLQTSVSQRSIDI